MDDIIGNPEVQADYCEPQMWNDNCLVCAETSIIKQFGINIDQGSAAYNSAVNGWYMPGSGTSAADMGNLMDLYGVENHTVTNASIADLAQELKAGHGVVVSIRSDQLWDQGAGQELINFLAKLVGIDSSEYQPADHAIVVTGIGDSPEGPVVYINDSGVPDGAAQPYPLDRFMDAWENGGFTYVATDDPLPSLVGDGLLDNNIWDKWIPVGTEGETTVPVENPVLGGFMSEMKPFFLRLVHYGIRKLRSDIMSDDEDARLI